jgi:hypothetical protein
MADPIADVEQVEHLEEHEGDEAIVPATVGTPSRGSGPGA